jgi:hypothetical protein
MDRDFSLPNQYYTKVLRLFFYQVLTQIHRLLLKILSQNISFKLDITKIPQKFLNLETFVVFFMLVKILYSTFSKLKILKKIFFFNDLNSQFP